MRLAGLPLILCVNCRGGVLSVSLSREGSRTLLEKALVSAGCAPGVRMACCTLDSCVAGRRENYGSNGNCPPNKKATKTIVLPPSIMTLPVRKKFCHARPKAHPARENMVPVLSSELSIKLSNLTSDWTTSPMIVGADPVDAPSPHLVPVMQTWFIEENTDLTKVAGVILPYLQGPSVVSGTPKRCTPARPPCAASRERTRPQQDWGHSPDSSQQATDTLDDTAGIENIVVSIPCSFVDEEKQLQSPYAIDLGDNDEVQSLLDAAPDFPIEGVELGEDLVETY